MQCKNGLLLLVTWKATVRPTGGHTTSSRSRSSPSHTWSPSLKRGTLCIHSFIPNRCHEPTPQKKLKIDFLSQNNREGRGGASKRKKKNKRRNCSDSTLRFFCGATKKNRTEIFHQKKPTNKRNRLPRKRFGLSGSCSIASPGTKPNRNGLDSFNVFLLFFCFGGGWEWGGRL